MYDTRNPVVWIMIHYTGKNEHCSAVLPGRQRYYFMPSPRNNFPDSRQNQFCTDSQRKIKSAFYTIFLFCPCCFDKSEKRGNCHGSIRFIRREIWTEAYFSPTGFHLRNAAQDLRQMRNQMGAPGMRKRQTASSPRIKDFPSCSIRNHSAPVSPDVTQDLALQTKFLRGIKQIGCPERTGNSSSIQRAQ